MHTETEPIRIDTPLGPLRIAVLPAQTEYYYDDDGRQTDTLPRLQVATGPGFTADPDHPDHWTIRRRAYAVHHIIQRKPERYGHDNRWGRESTPYRGGFRNSKRQPVEFRTFTWNLMDETLTAALDTFAAQYPGWETLSCYLRKRADQHIAETEAADLRRQAAERDRTALACGREAAALADTVPASLLNLVKGDL